MIDPGAALVISIFNLLWILGFMKLDKRMKKLEQTVEILDEEKKLRDLVEVAKERNKSDG